jgi:hypothetical protein
VTVTSVVRGVAGDGAVRITVHGAWRAEPAGGSTALLVHAGEDRRAVPALPAPAAQDPADFHAVFDLPPDLAGTGAGALVLAVGGTEIPLPAALPGVPPAPERDVAAEAPPVPAEVIDRAVLAEHRARRAEQGLEALQERLRTLEAHLADVTADRDRLREELDEAQAGERRRHASLLEQVARLREAAAAAEGLQAALAAAQGERDASAERAAAASEELDGLRGDLDAVREELDVVREERDGLREAVARADRGVRGDAAVGFAELGEIARALRERAEDQLAAQAPAEAPTGQDPFDVALAGLRARTLPPPEEADAAPVDNVIPFDPLRNTMNLAAMSPGRRARSRLRRVPPSERHVLHGDPVGADRRSGVTWLTAAVEAFAADDLRGAGAFVLSLLPDAARTLGEDLTFDVDLDGVGPHRVTLRNGAGSVVPRGTGAPREAAFRVAGAVGALAPLGTGGTPRRLGGGARVSGSRRALRRLLRARREPVDLADLAGAGVVPDPALLLRVLAAGVRPAWTGENDFAVSVDVPDRDPITVIAEPGRRLQVVGPPPEGGAVRAVVTTSPAALLALVGRVAPPEGDDAWVSGEEEVVHTMLELLDRAQGLPSRG